MKLLNANDVAIARAIRKGTLKLILRFNERLQQDYVSIEDERGMFEVALSLTEAEQRVEAVRSRM